MRLLLALLLLFATPAFGAPLTAAEKTRIDQAVQTVLAQTAAPSASIAVVKDGKVDYLQAYGDAARGPRVAARPAMRYAIGSVSKQFTAVALLLLQEEGKLSIDDPVARWFPELPDADKITIRHLLGHTSGYPDFWPQDYLMPPMAKAVRPDDAIADWAARPRDFAPNEAYQYSNTGYMIAGRIVEMASGEPLFGFLNRRVFARLGMKSAYDFDRAGLRSPPDAAGFRQAGLAPPRPALVAGPGWALGAFGLAMTAEDLARWDVCVITECLLSAASHAELAKSGQLRSGRETRYALGLIVGEDRGRPRLSHTGEVAGFVAFNAVYPDDGVAIVILVNMEHTSAASLLGAAIADILLPTQSETPATADPPPPVAPILHLRIARVLDQLSTGKAVGRTDLSDNFHAYLTPALRADFAASLGPLGKPVKLAPRAAPYPRGGLTGLGYLATYADGRTLRINLFLQPDGRIEQFLVAP